MIENFDYKKFAKAINEEIQNVQVKNVPNLRRIRKKYSKLLNQASPEQVLNFVRYFIKNYNYRWIPFEILFYHKTVNRTLGEKELEEFGTGINNWGAVDVFAGYLAGPAWRNGQVSDGLILNWANSKDFWWRRTALVCTVPLNRHTLGGQGDILRTLKICKKLAADKNDMVVKALSWALRELIPHDKKAVQDFIQKNDKVLAPRVKREVNNKLITGLKNPKKTTK